MSMDCKNLHDRARTSILTAEDREEARVRTLLYGLRPDCADPLRPPPPAPTAAPTVRVRDPMADWGGVPRGVGAPAALEAMFSVGLGALARSLAALPADARAVCIWLRDRADLAQGLRGLYCDVGLAFADAAQTELWSRDLTARRDGAHHSGRTLVLGAAKAWGIPVA